MRTIQYEITDGHSHVASADIIKLKDIAVELLKHTKEKLCLIVHDDVIYEYNYFSNKEELEAIINEYKK